MVRKYKGSREEYEQKLGRVMGRLGVRGYVSLADLRHTLRTERGVEV